MGLFICLKNPTYKNELHNEIETRLTHEYGYIPFSLTEFKRILALILKATNSSGETFCKKFDSTGKLQGISTAMIAGHSTGDDTVLILSNKDSIEEIQNADDIQAILIFNYDEEDESVNKYELNIFVLCSNQITKSGGGKVLLQNLIDISKTSGMRTIFLAPSENAISYYKRFNFELDPVHNFMTLQLGGRKQKKRKYILYSRKRNKMRQYSRKQKKSKTNKIKLKNK
jgi:hypothetical protein